jgi:hypothetical protein
MTATKVTIDDLDPPIVNAFLAVPTFFTIIGSGLSEEIYVYISTQADGSDNVSWPDSRKPPKIKIDRASSGTDKLLPLAATPDFDAFPRDVPLYVAIKLKDRDGPFQSAKLTFKLT